MEPELWELMKDLHKLRRVNCLFVFHLKKKKIGDFRKSWNRACLAIGRSGLLFHDLRRSAIRNMVRAGVAERVAMTISGHKTRSVFDRYNIVSQDDLKEAARKRQIFSELQAGRLHFGYISANFEEKVENHKSGKLQLVRGYKVDAPQKRNTKGCAGVHELAIS